MVLCNTLGLYQPAVSTDATICLIPNQSAVRIIVPKLPGSCIPSNNKVDVFLKSDKAVSFYFSTKAITLLGVCSRLSLPNIISSTSTTSAGKCP